MHYQLQAISKEKNKALKILVETKDKLEKVRKLATDFMNQNQRDINEKRQQIGELEENQIEIQHHIQSVEKSIAETDKILGV